MNNYQLCDECGDVLDDDDAHECERCAMDVCSSCYTQFHIHDEGDSDD